MRRLLNQVSAFLKAEEVPRWFGLSLVLIYLIGLATVANVGILQARSESAHRLQESSRHALQLLAGQLEHIYEDGREAASVGAGVQRALRDFAVRTPVQMLRVVEGGRVLASLDVAEIGSITAAGTETAPGENKIVESAGSKTSDEIWLIRVPMPVTAASALALTDSADERYLEARIARAAFLSGNLSGYAGVMSIVLVVLGALFVAYRCLREQMRGVARIADRLKAHRDRIRDELASLRISDAARLDGVTTAWNELVDLAQKLLHNTERNEADAELMRVLQSGSCNALGDALNALPDGFMHIRDENRIDYLNTSAARLMGWDPQHAGGTLMTEAHAEGVGKRILALIRENLQPNGTYLACSDVLETEDENGAPSTLRVWLMPVRRQHAEGECIVVIRDVSQQMRAEKSREEFSTQVTHELRTPLTNIRAYAETLSSGVFDDPEVITECYNVIMKETRRLSRLIEDMLSVSQLEVGSISLSLDDVDLKTLLTEGVRDVRGIAEEKNIDIQLVLPAKLEQVRGDRDKLGVVINNLLGNSVKYTPRNGNVIVGCQASGKEVMVTVKDNGIGIDASDQARVFEKFQRGRDPEVQAETGTGIGLFTAREIVRRHGGDIELISAKGKGSTFMVRLPLRESRTTSISTQATKT